MGPVRRQLIPAILLALLVMATPALASVCTDLRPGWDAAGGAVGAVTETMRVLASLPGLVVLASLAFGLWRPNLWISTACAVPALAMGGLLAMSNHADTAVAARAEGCLGSYYPAAFLLVALAGLTIIRAWRQR